MTSFKKWLKLIESGTLASSSTGGIGDIAQYKKPIFTLIRRNWPIIGKNKKSNIDS